MNYKKKFKSSFYRNFKTKTENQPPEEKILFKGENTIEDINGEYVIESPIQYDRILARKNLQIIKSKSKIRIDQLDQDSLNIFYKLISVSKDLQNEPVLLKKYQEDVRDHFKNIKIEAPKTVASYFVEPKNPLDCDPLYEDSIFNQGFPKCNHLILSYNPENGKIEELNSVSFSNVCYIYIDKYEKDFKGFNKNDIQKINKYKCNSYYLLFSGYKKGVIKDSVTIDQLPLNEQNNSVIKYNSNIVNGIDDTEWNPFITLLIIILFVVLLILVSLFAYYYHKETYEYDLFDM